MDSDLPTPPQGLFRRESGIFQPTLIQEVRRAIWISRPCQGGDRIDYKAMVLQAFGLVKGNKLARIYFSSHSRLAPHVSQAFHKPALVSSCRHSNSKIAHSMRQVSEHGLFGSQERTGWWKKTWHNRPNADELHQDRGTRTVQVPAVS
jgi:hypothetical protein